MKTSTKVLAILAVLGLLGWALAPGQASAAAIGASESVIDVLEPWREVDIERLPAHYKGRRRPPRDIKAITKIIVHQTAVKRGFGVIQPQIKKAGGVEPAFLGRWQKTPYHAIYSPRASSRASKIRQKRGMLVIQWPAVLRTWHGHQGNDGLGWAYDGLLPGDDLDVEGARQAFAEFVQRMRNLGAPISEVETHAQHSADRGADPGAEIWQQVIRPMLGPLGLTHSTRVTSDGGLPNWL